MSDHGDRAAAFQADCGAWFRQGRLKYREDIVDGLESAPAALLNLRLIVRRGGRLAKRFSIDAPDQLPPALPCDLGGGASYIEPSGHFLGYSERGRIRGHGSVSEEVVELGDGRAPPTQCRYQTPDILRSKPRVLPSRSLLEAAPRTSMERPLPRAVVAPRPGEPRARVNAAAIALGTPQEVARAGGGDGRLDLAESDQDGDVDRARSAG